MLSPTQRSLAHLKNMGSIAQVVEKWNPFVPRPDGGRGVHQDLFGIIDILSMHDYHLLGVQTTSGSNMTNRTKKALEECRLRLWLILNLHFEIWTWAKKGPRGKRKAWTLKRRVFYINKTTDKVEYHDADQTQAPKLADSQEPDASLRRDYGPSGRQRRRKK